MTPNYKRRELQELFVWDEAAGQAGVGARNRAGDSVFFNALFVPVRVSSRNYCLKSYQAGAVLHCPWETLKKQRSPFQGAEKRADGNCGTSGNGESDLQTKH